MLSQAEIRQHGIFYIRNFGDPILNRSMPEVEEYNGSLNLCIESMKKFLSPNAIGLAAPQVGVQRRIFVWQLDDTKPREIINPKIIDHGAKTFVSHEGCLSLPGMNFQILRWQQIVIEGYNLSEKKVQFKGSDMRASLYQHEIDHLNGVLPINSINRVA